MRRILAVLVAIACTGAFSPAEAAPAQRVRGAVIALSGDTLSVKTAEGPVSVVLAPHLAVIGIAKAALSDVHKGAFIGVGGRPQPDGTIKAIQVFVFPEAMRGRGEGHRPWGVLPDTTMTNATVESVVSSAKGPDVTLTYPGGEKTTVIPPDANIITAVPAERAALVAGAEVALVAERQADGSLHADRVSIAVAGATLPL